jgi:hypothetical protein
MPSFLFQAVRVNSVSNVISCDVSKQELCLVAGTNNSEIWTISFSTEKSEYLIFTEYPISQVICFD